jgi:WD40 repeat protein
MIDVKTNEPIAFINTSTSSWSNWQVGVVELANSKILFWNGKDKFLHIWDYRRSNLLPKFQSHYSKVAGALELMDHSILSWHWDTRLVLWDRKSGKCILVLEGHAGAVTEAKELSDGNILSWSEDKTLRIWDRKSGKCILVLEGHAGAVTEAKELSDGNILSLSRDDWSNETLTIWNTHSGTACLVSRGYKSKIIRAGELPDGQIFSWHNDCSIKLYNRFIFGDEKLIENKDPKNWTSTYKEFVKIFKEFQLNLLNLQHKVSSVSKNILIADKGTAEFKIFINTKNSFRKFDRNHNIRIARGGKTYGPYDRKTIEECLASGRLVSNDWAWTSGMKEWTRLKDLLEE